MFRTYDIKSYFWKLTEIDQLQNNYGIHIWLTQFQLKTLKIRKNFCEKWRKKCMQSRSQNHSIIVCCVVCLQWSILLLLSCHFINIRYELSSILNRISHNKNNEQIKRIENRAAMAKVHTVTISVQCILYSVDIVLALFWSVVVVFAVSVFDRKTRLGDDFIIHFDPFHFVLFRINIIFCVVFLLKSSSNSLLEKLN